ncbi:MAG: hypothetical protein AAF663_10725, partial [Planctomycetota bacterium]
MIHGHFSIEVLFDHVAHPRSGVPERVREVAVVDLDEQVGAEGAIGGAERAAGREEVAEGVEAELFDVVV